MCYSKSFCSFVELLDHWCQCFAQFLVHSTVQYCNVWLFCINTPHTTNLNACLLLFKALVHTDNQFQQGIVDAWALAYQAAPLDVVQVALTNVGAVDVSAYQNKMESVSATQILVVATPDNTKRSCLFQEGLKFSAITIFFALSQ